MTLKHLLNYLSLLRVKVGVRVIFSLVAQTVKESACSAGDQNLIPGLGTSLREGNGHPLGYSWSMGPWVPKSILGPWVPKSQT